MGLLKFFQFVFYLYDVWVIFVVVIVLGYCRHFNRSSDYLTNQLLSQVARRIASFHSHDDFLSPVDRLQHFFNRLIDLELRQIILKNLIVRLTDLFLYFFLHSLHQRFQVQNTCTHIYLDSLDFSPFSEQRNLLLDQGHLSLKLLQV